jgi:hypothetical protein
VAPPRRQFEADRGTVDAGQVTEQHYRRRHHRTGIPGTDEGIRVAASDEAEADADRAVALAPQRLDGTVLHFHHLRGVAYVDRQVPDTMPRELVGDLVAIADERHRDAQLAGSGDGALDDRLRGVITPHRIDGNGFHRPKACGHRSAAPRLHPSATSTTCLPRYCPQWGQARCRCVGSPQAGQATYCGTTSASWARRLLRF